MKYLYDVFFVMDIPSKGFLIGGANSDLDPLTKEEIVDYIGEKVIVTDDSNNRVTVDVLGVEITSSIVDRKNIYILIPSEYNSVAVGSSVYKE